MIAWLAFALSACAWADARVEIGRIELTGVTVLSSREIEPVLEVSPGDTLEQIKVVRSAQNIQQLYRSHGYERVSIQSKISRSSKRSETVLEFIVSEGNPTRIASVEFRPLGEVRPETEKSWPRLKTRLESKFSFAEGMLLDRVKIGDAQRGLQEVLASEEYVGSRVLDAEIVSVPPPTGAQPVAARWVALTFRIELGDRVSFGFRGNSAFSRSSLSELVEEQRLLGLGRDYESVVARKIEEKYRSEGFANAKVISYSYDERFSKERHVTFQIEEGPKVQIDSIDFDGNQFFDSNLLRSQYKALGSALVQNSVFYEKDVQKAAEALIDWIKSQGFLSAKLFTVNIQNVPLPRSKVQGSRVRLLVYLYEGDQTRVKSFAASGNQVLSQADISNILRVKEREPLNLFALTEGLETLKAVYRDKGYLDVKIANEGSRALVEYSQDERWADIQVQVEEGRQIRVSSIEIEGLSHTDEDVVRRELLFEPGDVLEEHLILESRTQLNRLGIFSTVEIRVLDDLEKPDHRRIRVLVDEAGRLVLEAGPGFRSDIGVRAFAQGTYSNAWGRNHSASLRLSTNARVVNRQFIEAQARASYVWPWVFLGPTLLRATGSLERWQYRNFNADTVNFVLSLERRLFKSVPLVANLAYSLESDNQYGALFTQDNGSFRIGALTPSLRLDYLDNSLAPTSGFYISGVFDWAHPAILSQVGINYTRASLKTEGYIPLFRRRSKIALSVRMGLERNADPAGSIPLIKQYSLGGTGTMRGFQEQEINIQDIRLGGIATFVNYRIQWDLPFVGQLQVGPFLDMGNLLVTGTNTSDNTVSGSARTRGLNVPLDAPITPFRFFFGELVMVAGFGVRYNTPIGPFSLDWGFQLNSVQLNNRIDISVGRIF